jgi:RNA polymerase sigma factor (sigma-70 family)
MPWKSAMNADSGMNAIQGSYANLHAEVWSGRESAAVRVSSLFEEHKSAVYRHVLMMLKNASESEDVTQEAFLRLHSALTDDKGIEDMKAWVFKVAHNLSLDRLRMNKNASSLSEETVMAKAEAHCAYRLPNPEQALLSKERFERLDRAILQLSPRQQECLSLKAEGFRYHQIATILGVGRATVIENIRRAMIRLVGEFQF